MKRAVRVATPFSIPWTISPAIWDRSLRRTRLLFVPSGSAAIAIHPLFWPHPRGSPGTESGDRSSARSSSTSSRNAAMWMAAAGSSAPAQLCKSRSISPPAVTTIVTTSLISKARLYPAGHSSRSRLVRLSLEECIEEAVDALHLRFRPLVPIVGLAQPAQANIQSVMVGVIMRGDQFEITWQETA